MNNTDDPSISKLPRSPQAVVSDLDIDIEHARLSFDRAAAEYDQHTWFQQEIGSRLLERLEVLNPQPQVIVDMGCGTGVHSLELKKRYPKTRVIGIDFSAEMLTVARQRNRWHRKVEYLQADMAATGLADASVDMIFSNLSLQWATDLRQVFNEFRRILRPGGLLLLSTLGPETLSELRAAWAKVDNHTHVNPFVDIKGVGDTLMACGFHEPVADAELLTLTYSSVHRLMRELKGMGAHNVNRQRRHTLTGASRIRRMCAAYKEFCLPDGRFPASWEVIYAAAWEPDEGQPIRTEQGEEASFSVAHLLSSRGKK